MKKEEIKVENNKNIEKKNSGFIKNILEQDLNLLNNNTITNKVNNSKSNKIKYDIDMNEKNKQKKKKKRMKMVL